MNDYDEKVKEKVSKWTISLFIQLTFSSHHSFPSGFCLAPAAKQVNQTLLIINVFQEEERKKANVEKIKVIEFFMNSEGAWSDVMKYGERKREKEKSGKVNYKNVLFIIALEVLLKVFN